MKLLCFSDTHGSKKAIEKIVNNSKNADLVLCAGDLSDFGENLPELLKLLSNSKCPVLLVHGNHEDIKEMDKLCNKYENLTFIHKGSFELNNYVFFGYGGMGFSKRDTDFELTAKNFLKTKKKDQKIVLLTHAPPYGTKLDFLTGFNYVGNQSLRAFIEQVKPELHVCGHIHENKEKHDNINKTIILNPGPKGKLIKI